MSAQSTAPLSAASYRTLAVTPLTPAIGAELSGVDLSSELSAEVIGEIRQALLQYMVIFFREQQLEPADLIAFAKRFGEISFYPFVEGMRDYPEIVEVVKKEDETINFGGLWHTDTAYLEEPPLGSILYAVDVPPAGGDTLWSNMYLAYDALSPTMKTLLEPLKAVNSAEKPDAAVTRVNRIADQPRDAANIVTEAAHPIVRTHPETGRKALYCSDAHVTHIEGMSVEESRPLLNYLYGVQQRPEFACRFHWTPGSVAFWDNRCSQHNALNDYHGHRRVMQRVTLAGDRPS